MKANRPKCWIGVKVFGNELSVLTCEDLYDEMDQLSLSAAGLAVKLLKVYRSVSVCRFASSNLGLFSKPPSLFVL